MDYTVHIGNFVFLHDDSGRWANLDALTAGGAARIINIWGIIRIDLHQSMRFAYLASETRKQTWQDVQSIMGCSIMISLRAAMIWMIPPG
jgi:hypothetical protein